MKKRETDLKVLPLKSYKVPKYPSYYDNFNRIDGNKNLFQMKHTSLIIASALSVASFLKIPADENEKEPKENPFKITKSGLPHQTSPFGTGAPSRLEDENANKFIMQIFKEEGVQLTKDFKYDKNGIQLEVTGYNEKLKIGFLFGSYKTLDEDAIVNWSLEKDEELEVRLSGYNEAIANNVFENKYKKEIGEIFKEADKNKRAKQLVVLYKDEKAKNSLKKLSLVEAKSLENDAVKNKEFIAVISKFDERITFQFGGVTSTISEIMNTKDKEVRDKLYKSLLKKEETDFEKDTIQKIMNLEENVRRYIKWAKSQGL